MKALLWRGGFETRTHEGRKILSWRSYPPAVTAGVALAGSAPSTVLFSLLLSPAWLLPVTTVSPVMPCTGLQSGVGLGRSNWDGPGPLVTFTWHQTFLGPPNCLPAHSRSSAAVISSTQRGRPCAGSMVPRESRHPLCSGSSFIILPPRLHWAGNGHSTADLPPPVLC